MNADILVKNLPFEIPKDEFIKLNRLPDLESRLNSIRSWIHYNQNITHEVRLSWHKPILDLAKKNNLLSSQAYSLANMAKVYDRLGQFNQSLKANKAAQKIRNDLKKAVGKVRQSKDPKVLNTLKTQLDRLNAIGGLKSVVPSEGITFVFKGKLYKYTGAFAPANQILGMLKFV